MKKWVLGIRRSGEEFTIRAFTGLAADKHALKLAAFQNRKFPESNAQILRNYDGLAHRIHIVTTFESVAAWEAARDSNDADPDFQSLLAEGGDLYDLASLEGHFYQIVE